MFADKNLLQASAIRNLSVWCNIYCFILCVDYSATNTRSHWSLRHLVNFSMKTACVISYSRHTTIFTETQKVGENNNPTQQQSEIFPKRSHKVRLMEAALKSNEW